MTYTGPSFTRAQLLRALQRPDDTITKRLVAEGVLVPEMADIPADTIGRLITWLERGDGELTPLQRRLAAAAVRELELADSDVEPVEVATR